MPDATEDEVYRKLDELYASLPNIKCQGLCWNSCGPIAMSTAERLRILDAGVDIPTFNSERSQRWADNEPLHCPALTRWGRCSVYELRPLICRIWGNGRGDMACPHGCERDERPRLRHGEILGLIAESMLIGGDDNYQWGELDRALFDDPDVHRALINHMSLHTPQTAIELAQAAQRARERLHQEDQ